MKLPSHLLEAQRLLDSGMKLIKLKPNTKQPPVAEWNSEKNYAKQINPTATGYGIPLAVNGLCSVDPDDVEPATIGMAALGFDLEEIMGLGVRTCSTREGSGGRVTFKATPDLRWLRFGTKDTGLVLEFRAHSDNLQDCVPGVQYLDKAGNECTQDYDVFSMYQFDNAPELPADLLAWWTRMSEDNDFYMQQQGIFFAALDIEWQKTNTHNKHLYGESRMRISYNEAHKVEELLAKHGYEDHGNHRWSAPSSTGAPGIRPIPGKVDLWRSDHGSDVLNGTFDAWTAYVLLEHGGDVDAAERAEGECILDEFEVLADDGAVMSGFDALEAEARAVDGRDALKAFAEKVSAVRNEVLSEGDRTVLAAIIAKAAAFKGLLSMPTVRGMLKFKPTKLVDHRDRPKYERDDDGGIKTTTGNIVLALGNEGEIGTRFTYDSFTDQYLYAAGDGWKQLRDEHYTELLIRLEKLGIYHVTNKKVAECLCLVCRNNEIDSAQDWLKGLEWDGVPRVRRFFVDYFGAEDTPYTEAVGAFIWSAMAARVMVPGHQVDMIPVLVGGQGVGKSTGIAAMSPRPEFFSEFSFGEKEVEVARRMTGKLVGEISELRGLRGREGEHIKGWITRRVEDVRRMYENTVRQFPRRLCFLGTTNEDTFLSEDPSGQRRWLPVRVTRGDVERIRRDCAQLWAEGAAMFARDGVAYRDAEEMARLVHEDFVVEDIFEVPVLDYLESVRDGFGGYPILTMNEILWGALKLEDAKARPHECSRISGLLRKHGWKSCKHKKVRSWKFEA